MINFDVYTTDFNLNFNNNYLSSNFNIRLNIYEWMKFNNKSFITDLVFPETKTNKITKTSDKDQCSDTKIFWDKLKLRPFKICPCNYKELLDWSNNSYLNICIFNQSNKIIGLCIISLLSDCYFINILCTNINQGIGKLIIEFVKSVIDDKPIKLISTFNSKIFYLKMGFVVDKNNSNMMVWTKN